MAQHASGCDLQQISVQASGCDLHQANGCDLRSAQHRERPTVAIQLPALV